MSPITAPFARIETATVLQALSLAFSGKSSAGVGIGAAILALIAGSGCVNVYQPLVGLQNPVVVDTQSPNFAGLHVVVRCVPEDFLDERDAGILCTRMEELFVAQGATVKTISAKTKAADEEEEGEPTEVEAPLPEDTITVELRAKKVNADTSALLWVFSILTVSLVPAMSEYTYVQEVVVRDRRGVRLASAELKGRLVRYYGLGAWAGTRLTNLIFRDDEEDITNRAFRQGISNDLYGQVSQMVFNARMRQRVLSRTVSTVATSSVAGR